jgi:hypothetical protein
MGRKNAVVAVATWEVPTYLLAEEPLLGYLDSGLDAGYIAELVPGISPEELRRAVVLLFGRLRAGAEDYEGYYEVRFNPHLVDFFWVTHRFVFDREHHMIIDPDGTRRVNHPLESMGLPYYVALWGLVERIRIWNNTAVRIEYTKPKKGDI